MYQIFRENLKYILLVFLCWAITFPLVYENRDRVLAWANSRFNGLFENPNPRIVRSLLERGDSILEGRKQSGTSFVAKIVAFFQTEENPKNVVLPLDLALMEKSCLYYQTQNHISEEFLEPRWREKATDWGSPLFPKNPDPRELKLGPHPRDYWNSHISPLLEILDLYKRALQFSGPDFQVPKKIESVAWAACRPSEILLAYRTHMSQTEEYVLKKMKKEGKIIPSGLTEVQVLSIALSQIKKSTYPEVSPNDYLESLLRQILLSGMKSFSPLEVDKVYERILFIVSGSETEVLKYRFRRGELFLQVGKRDNKFLKLSIEQFREAMNIDRASENEDANFPLLLVHQFQCQLRIAQAFYTMGEYKTSLRELDALMPKLRNVDERSVGGEKKDIVKDFKDTKRMTLRKLGRYEEADEIPP